MSEEQNRFSLRKLSVGLASVLVGVSIFGTSQTVKADTVANNQTSSVTSNAQSSDTQKNENAVKSTFPNDNQANNVKNNLIQTQVEGKKDQKQDSVPKTQEVTDSSNLDAEKDIVRTSSLQEPDNQSNNHAEGNSQTQNEQKLDITKNSQLAKKVLATNLIETSNDDWADPAKHGFHYTNAGWTKEYQGKNPSYEYTSIAKKSNTILLDTNSGKELSKDQSYEIGSYRVSFGTEISATVDKNDIKQGNRVLLSSTAILFKDGRGLDRSLFSINVNVISNGVKIGHIETRSDGWGDNSSEFEYVLVVDQTQNMTKDLDLHMKIGNSACFNMWGANYAWLKGTTPTNPVNTKVITNNSTAYNYTWYVDPSIKTQIEHPVASSNFGIKDSDLSSGISGINNVVQDPNSSFTTNNTTINRVLKISRPKAINGVAIPNFKTLTKVPYFQIRSLFPELSKDGIIGDSWASQRYTFSAIKLADDASVQQIAETAKNQHFVYSVSSDGQSMLLGINVPLGRENLNKLTNVNYTENDVISDLKNNANNSRTVVIEHPDEVNDIINRSTNWIKSHNGEPYSYNMIIGHLPTDVSQPNIETISDVTPNVKNPSSRTNSLFPKNSDLHFDVSVYKQINVRFIDDDDNEKIINTDTFQTSTGTDLTYNIKDPTDKAFNSATDIAFPKNFVLNQTSTVHYGVIQDTNPDIVIHVKHLVKVVSGDADLDLYPEIKKALNGDARRTITITYPAGKQRNNPSIIVQSVHYIRSGKVDFTNDTVDESSLTKWNPVASSAHGVTITNGETTFDAVKLPHINGYKAHLVRNKINPAMLMVSFVAVPTETKPSNPVEVAPSKPSANADNTNKPADDLKDLKQRVVTELNSNDSGWTMPNTQPATYTVEVPDDNTIDLSNLVIAKPIHAQTRTQIRVNKRFKLSKKHSIKHLKHRKKAVRQFKKYRL